MKIVLLTILLMLTACGASEKQAPVAKGATVLVLGDSLTYGTGANAGEDYPALLAANTGWQVINAGVPGDTSAQGLARLPALLAEHQPQLLVIELGGNDFLQRLPVAETSANLKLALAQAKAKNIRTVLVAIPEFSPLKAAVGHLADHPLYEALAKETNTPLVEAVFSEVLSESQLRSDQVHPNAAGYQMVGTKMTAALKQLGLVK